jgi:threonine dehydrogenase-like Zn-dependent dehydrogenase
MIAAYKKNREVILKEKHLRELNPREIRLKVEACGICGTDLSGEDKDFSPFGHEVAGEIVECGCGVDYLRVGQKVVLDSATPCGRCSSCKDGKQELCEDIQSFFFLEEFGFSEEMIAPGESAIPYDMLSPQAATLQEPLGVAIDMVRLGEIGKDNNILIIGLGPIGLMAAALVKRANANRVFVSDFKERSARIELAVKWGADEFVDPKELTDYNFNCQIDRILVTAPPSTLDQAFRTACKGAIISFIGIGHGDAAFCRFDANEFHFKKLQLRASFASPALFGPQALRYLIDGTVKGEDLISHTFSLKRIQDAMDIARESPDALKVVVIPGGSE